MSKTKTQQKSTCSYCHHIGHAINNCKDPSIEILDKTILEKMIFITVLFRSLISNYDIISSFKELLNVLSYEELKILIYKKNLKKLTINDEKNTYVHYLRVNYGDTVYSYSKNVLKQKFNEISDENYKTYGDEYLKTNVISESFELEELLLNRMYEFRPPQRKFDIKTTTANLAIKQTHVCPICLDEITPTNQIITNCNHTFCNDCIQKYFKSLNSNINNPPICAYCRDPMKSLEIPDPSLCKQIQTKYCNQDQDQDQELKIIIDNTRNIYREILVPRNPPPRPERPIQNPDHFNVSILSIFYRFIGL